MTLLFVILFVIIILIFINYIRNTRLEEGLCGNYSLTYSKIKDIFANSDKSNPNISGISQAYNTHYNRDLVINCF